VPAPSIRQCLGASTGDYLRAVDGDAPSDAVRTVRRRKTTAAKGKIGRGAELWKQS
jgi:hypothetical protein